MRKCADCGKIISQSLKENKSGYCFVCAKLGDRNPMKRKEIANKVHSILRGRPKVNFRGENATNWKGDRIQYSALHAYVKTRKPKPELCVLCKLVPPYDLANISPKYNIKTYTRNLENWEWLCRSCHMKSDGRMISLIKNRPKEVTLETRKKMSINRKGKKFTNKHKKNLSKALFKYWND